jgi:hypothetical protein
MMNSSSTTINRALDFLRHAFIAAASCAVGGVVGYSAFVGIYSLHLARLPRVDELAPPAVVPSFGAAIGAIFGVGLQACVGAVRRPGLWAIGFLVAGGIAAPIAFIALVTYAMSGRPY